MSDGHEWCRDVRRDEQVRAAEDAAAVPAIQHRDLPEQVALLWASLGDIIGRVVRLEGEMDAGQDEEAAPAEGMRKEHGESVRVVDEADAASDEAVAHGATLSALAEARESLAAANRGIARPTAERDAAIRERDEAKKECERLRAKIVAMEGQSRMETEAEIAVEEAWERCGIAPYWPDDEPGTSHRYAKSMEAEIVRLRARVAELEAAPAANAGGEQQPPRGWLTEEMRDDLDEALEWLNCQTNVFAKRAAAAIATTLARETPPRVKRRGPWTINGVPGDGSQAWKPMIDAILSHRDDEWIAAIRAAGGEVEG